MIKPRPNLTSKLLEQMMCRRMIFLDQLAVTNYKYVLKKGLYDTTIIPDIVDLFLLPKDTAEYNN